MLDVKIASTAPVRPLMEAVAVGLLLFAPTAVYMAADRAGLVVPAAAAAAVILFVVPNILGVMAFYRIPATRAAAPVWGIAVNSLALVIVCLLLRQTVGIGRTALLTAWLGWTLALLLVAWRPGESLARLTDWARGYGSAAAIGLVASLAGMIIMFPEQFQQCFNEDGTETYELAHSLQDHFLPYRELETWDPIPGGRMGTVVVNPSLMNSYWTFGLLTLIDDRQIVVRLPFWIWSLGGFLVAVRLVGSRHSRGTRLRVDAVRQKPPAFEENPRLGPQGGRQTASACYLGRRAWAAIPLAALMLLAAVNFTFYAGYDRYMADIGNPGVTDALFTMLLLMSYDSLARGARWAWAVSMLMDTLVLYAGPVMFLLSVGAMLLWKPISRRQTLRWAATAGALLLATAAFYAVWGWRDGSLRYWIDTFDQEYVNHYLAQKIVNGHLVHVSRLISAPLFLGYFVLGAGGIAALGIVTALRRDAWQRTVASVTLLYLAIVLGSGFKNLHWLAPLWPVPLILFLRGSGERGAGSGGRGAECARPAVWRSLIATASILICLVVSWPRQRATFTLNRDLGRQTTILTDRYLSAATWARVRLVLREKHQIGWNCDAWTWVTYSEMASRPQTLRPLVLTDGEAPATGYWLLASRPVDGTAIVARLFCRDKKVEGWLKTASSPEPVDRYPWVYQPLAAGELSPHNKNIEDVQRLGW